MITAIAGTTFSKAIALLDYRLNGKYIAASLCENRNKPSCCCHGKCFLKKQLQKDEDGKNASPFSKDKFDFSLFYEVNQIPQDHDLIREEIFYDHYFLSKYTSFQSPVFHPPGKQSLI